MIQTKDLAGKARRRHHITRASPQPEESTAQSRGIPMIHRIKSDNHPYHPDDTVERELTTYSHHNSTMEGEKTSTIRG
jgi:hypothetical protein